MSFDFVVVYGAACCAAAVAADRVTRDAVVEISKTAALPAEPSDAAAEAGGATVVPNVASIAKKPTKVADDAHGKSGAVAAAAAVVAISPEDEDAGEKVENGAGGNSKKDEEDDGELQ